MSHAHAQKHSAVKPIDFDVAAKIEGHEAQIATITLEPGQVVRAESGTLVYMSDGVQIHTACGNFETAWRRALTGEHAFMCDFYYDGPKSGTVTLGTHHPSKILRFRLAGVGGSLICQKGSLLCSPPTVTIDIYWAKSVATGLFGGQGFILQHLKGEGDVLIKGSGSLIRKELARGETLQISHGCLLAFTKDIHYEVRPLKGMRNAVFGGESFYIATLVGPGEVWLQSQPFLKMVHEIAELTHN